jgi:hypothetical protein
MGEGMAWRIRPLATYGLWRPTCASSPTTMGDGSPRGARVVNYCRSRAGRDRQDPISVVTDCCHRRGPDWHAPPGRRTRRPGKAVRPYADDHSGRPRVVPDEPDTHRHSHAGLAVNPVLARVAANSVLASHPCCCDPMDLVGHCWFGRLDGDDCPGRRIGLGDSMATTLGAGASAGRGRRRSRAGTAYRLRSIYPARRSEALMPLIDQRLIQPTHLRRGTSL